MKNNESGRKALYLLPHIYLEEEIKLDKFSLIPMRQKYDLCKELIPQNVLDAIDFGSLIETPFFSSGDYFSSENHKKIQLLLKLIIFSFYSKSIGMYAFHHQPANVFDNFVFIEKNPDPSFEFKSNYFDGLGIFLFTQEIDYINKILSIKKNKLRITINKNYFSDFEQFKHLCNDKELINIVDKFIKTKSLYPVEDLGLVFLYARLSIETALKHLRITKKEYVSKFIDECFNRLELFVETNREFAYIFNHKIKPLHDKKELVTIINHYLKELSDARHLFVHEGCIPTSTSSVLNFYFVWFPLFFNLFFSLKKNNDEFNIKLINFFLLIQKDIKCWLDISPEWPPKANALTSYDMASILMCELLHSKTQEDIKGLKTILSVKGQIQDSIIILNIKKQLPKIDRFIIFKRNQKLNECLFPVHT